MIQRSSEGLQIPPDQSGPALSVHSVIERSWQEILAGAHRRPAELAAMLGIAADAISDPAAADFPLVVPDPYLARIDKGNPRDPLLLQVLPGAAELAMAEGYTADPLKELGEIPVTGMIRRFRGRVLITASSACGVNCRYCFRRHFPYQEQTPTREGWQQIFALIEGDDSISEVILSGGDPLVLSDRTLAWILEQLGAINHLRRIRIHTRMPIVIPQRVTPSLLTILQGCIKRMVIVIHCNHPREMDGAVRTALRALGHSALLLNQSVLLKGVNDSADTLIALSELLADTGVQPYYLHLLDRVAGAAHFEVSETRALALKRELDLALPGYLVPRLARDMPGAGSKQVLESLPGI